MRARHYSEAGATWTVTDPIWPIESPFTYAGCNPVGSTDPTGLACNMTIHGTFNLVSKSAICTDHWFCWHHWYTCAASYYWHASFFIYTAHCHQCWLYQLVRDAPTTWYKRDIKGRRWPLKWVKGNGTTPWEDWPSDEWTDPSCPSHTSNTDWITCSCCLDGSKCVTWHKDSSDSGCRHPVTHESGPTVLSPAASAHYCSGMPTWKP